MRCTNCHLYGVSSNSTECSACTTASPTGRLILAEQGRERVLLRAERRQQQQ